jgi:hypothetical protein
VVAGAGLGSVECAEAAERAPGINLRNRFLRTSISDDTVPEKFARISFATPAISFDLMG